MAIDYTNEMGRKTIQKTAKAKRNTARARRPKPSGQKASGQKFAGQKAETRLKVPAAKAAARPHKRSEQKPWTAAEIEEAFRRLREANPEPRGELEHIDPYTLLVAVVLSAQATDVGVNKATRALFAVADTPARMAALGEAGLTERIKTVGLYKTKAKNVIALSQALIRDHDGEVPNDRDALEALPGVGRKTANVVLNVAFGARTLAVDTHVFRISNRIPLAPGKTAREVEDGLVKVIPERFMSHAHHWLILHGRYTCMARAPACGRCVVRDLCTWEGKTGADPPPPARVRAKRREPAKKMARRG